MDEDLCGTKYSPRLQWKEEVKCLVIMGGGHRTTVSTISPPDGSCDLLCPSMWAPRWKSIKLLFGPTIGFRGCISNSVELCPMPLGIPAVRYMAPTVRLFLASLASFISSTVNPSSAKICTPALAEAPSSHSRKWRLWLTAKTVKKKRERERKTEVIFLVECISMSLKYHRASARRWDHFHHGAWISLPAL